MATKDQAPTSGESAIGSAIAEGIKQAMSADRDREILFQRSRAPLRVESIPEEVTIDHVVKQATRASRKLGNEPENWVPADKDTPDFMHAIDRRTGARGYARIRFGKNGERFAEFGGDLCMKSFAKNSGQEAKNVAQKMIHAIQE